MASQIDLGAVVPIGKGDWNSNTTYERANIVRHNSAAWVCKVATSKGVEPSESSSDWYLLVKDMSAVTSINGMRGDVTVDSILTNPSTDDSSLKIASTSWVKTKVDNAIDGVNTELSQVSSTASTALQTANSANTKADNALSKAEEASNKVGLPLGHIYLWPFSTPPDGSIQINGSTYSRELYSDLWNLIQAKGWYKPESEWQQIASANGGYCPWYSDGDGSTTFRTPKFAPYQQIAISGANAGMFHQAGLPSGKVVSSTSVNGQNIVLGPGSKLQATNNSYGLFASSTGFNATAPVGLSVENNADAISKGSPSDFIVDFDNIAESTTVQPESHDWIVCVVAFGTATNVGSVDVANVMSAVGQVQATAIEIDSSGYSSNQHWVRYKDGRQIIYSDWGSDFANTATRTFAKPFTTNPALIGFDNENLPANNPRASKFSEITGTYFKINDWAYGSAQKSGCWVAMGTWK